MMDDDYPDEIYSFQDPDTFDSNHSILSDINNDTHLTFRAIACGLLIGSLMCFSNMYFGLQTGWISMMSLQSSLLGFAIFKPYQRMLKYKFGPIENVLLQTTAVATATMPLAAGFVGVIPAMELMTKDDNPGQGAVVLNARQLILWALGVGFFGVFFAVPLRKETIIREKLLFPSGTATAQMISILHQIPDPTAPSILGENHHDYQSIGHNRISFDNAWILKLKGLVASFTISSVYTLASYFFPKINMLPIFNWITLNWIDFCAWEWYFAPSFSYIGQGIIMGLPTTLSMLAGCVTGWGILSPLAYYTGWAPGPIHDWKTGSKGWILWVSLGVMISESIVSLAVTFIKAIVKKRQNLQINDDDNEEQDAPKKQQVSLRFALFGLLASSIVCISLIQVVFGPGVLPASTTLLAILVAMFLSLLGVRALGETDLNPVSGIGKISQIFFGAAFPGSMLANLIAGGISEAGAQQAGDLMQDLKTGHLLHASPKAQFYGQIIGSFASVFIATGAYLLYRTIYSIPGPEFPVPTAQVWLDMSRLVNGHPLPPHVFEFIVGFGILFAALVILKEVKRGKEWVKWIPQGIAFAIGMYNPPSFTIARVIGGIACYYWNDFCDWTTNPKSFVRKQIEPYRLVGKVFIVVVASGFVLGEGTFAIVNMTMRVFNVPHF